MHQRTCLDASDVRVLMAAGRAEAERRSLPVTFAVVAEAGVLLALERLDGARLHTPDAAWLKARTAAITRTSTQDLQEAIQSIVVASGQARAGPGDLPEGARFISKPFSADVITSHIKEILPEGQRPEPLRA